MRYLAWIAIFSLQLGMFVCGAGIDVCDAADAPAHISTQTSNQIEPSPTQSDSRHSNTPVDTCAAHAAHVFLGQPVFNQSQLDSSIESIHLLASLNLPEILHLIEQPPKTSHC